MHIACPGPLCCALLAGPEFGDLLCCMDGSRLPACSLYREECCMCLWCAVNGVFVHYPCWLVPCLAAVSSA